jgi:phenylacetic acid degradation operon negative regulatory protein
LAFAAELLTIDDQAGVVREAWDLGAIADRYQTFIKDFDRIRPKSEEATFRAQAALVHAWRKFPFLDPELPEQLLPNDWPREKARSLFFDRHAKWSPRAEGFLRSLEG